MQTGALLLVQHNSRIQWVPCICRICYATVQCNYSGTLKLCALLLVQLLLQQQPHSLWHCYVGSLPVKTGFTEALFLACLLCLDEQLHDRTKFNGMWFPRAALAFVELLQLLLCSACWNPASSPYPHVIGKVLGKAYEAHIGVL